MGKKGDALRAAKAESAKYTFTAKQLEDHDRTVRKLYGEKMRSEWEKKIAEELEKAMETVEEDFKEREKMLTGNAEDVTLNVFSMLISISCKVLVRDFGWPPIYKHSTGRQRLARFITAVQQEVETILNREDVDIRRYAEEAYELTGVKLEAEDDESIP